MALEPQTKKAIETCINNAEVNKLYIKCGGGL